MRIIKAGLFISLLLAALGSTATAATDTIKLGFNAPMSGFLDKVGTSTRNAAELAREDIEKQGGIKIGGKTWKLEFLYGDNASDNTTATTLALSQIGRDHVMAIIGPQVSNNAIPVGGIANAYKTPMMTPWSTSPVTTKNRPYVFRTCFVYTVQGPMIADFVSKSLNKKKLAVLYDIVSAYPRGMANTVKNSFEDLLGPDSVVAFEEFRTNDTDYSQQIKRIIATKAEVLFVPQTDKQVAAIVKQARKLGFKGMIMGSNAWSGGDLMGACGDECKGLIFTGNYAPGGAKGKNKVFVDRYQKAYNRLPDEAAALTYDAVHSIVEALKKTDGLSGNVVEDREKLRTELVTLKGLQGVTGMLNYNASGNPDKCAVVVEIDQDGVFTTRDTVCP